LHPNIISNSIISIGLLASHGFNVQSSKSIGSLPEWSYNHFCHFDDNENLISADGTALHQRHRRQARTAQSDADLGPSYKTFRRRR
jgi:hypothetical protein